MRYRQSLRRRITFSFVSFGALLSLVIGVGVYFALEDIERSIVGSSLRAEMNYALRQTDLPLGITRQLSANIILYHVNEAQKGMVPDLIRNLPLGSHELSYEGETFHVLIGASNQGTVYVVEEATQFEQREIAIQIALVATVVGAILIALWLGAWLSGKVISPVTALARQVARLKPGQPHPSRVAAQYADDEVGQLAGIFDAYLQQMEQFIRREQEFTADASHELRTPLTVINGASELLLENPDLPDRARRQIERIARAGERMSQMLESLLLLARETPTGEAAEQEPYQVEDVAMEVLEHHRFMVRDKPVTLRCDIVSGYQLSASRTALAIVLSNLLRNAINYTEAGEVVMQVADRQVEISDSGAGIPADELEHIFDRHYRGRNAHQAGSGIGLSIVKRICDRQHWHIDIHSEPGKGTTVTLKF